MNIYWTLIESIHGLRHFVLVNRYKEKEDYILELVSVLDEEINLKISEKEFLKSNKWEPGFIDYQKDNIISKQYIEFKSRNRECKIKQIILRDNSSFNIS